MTVARVLGRLRTPRGGGGKEVNLETDRPKRAHLVSDIRWDRLSRAGSKLDLERRLRPHRETEPALLHDDPPPRARGEAVHTAETRRHAQLIPLGAGANKSETVRRLGPVAQRAGKRGPEPGRPPRVVGHPGPDLERGTVTDVLTVATRKLRDPVSFVVLVVSSDRPLHCDQATTRPSHITVVSIAAHSRSVTAGSTGTSSLRVRCSCRQHEPAHPLTRRDAPWRQPRARRLAE